MIYMTGVRSRVNMLHITEQIENDWAEGNEVIYHC